MRAGHGEAKGNMDMRERRLMDFGWKFCRGDITFEKGHGGWAKAGNFNMGAVDPSFNDSSWRTLDASAAASIAGALPRQSLTTMHGSLPMGVGWYRMTFFIPEFDLGRRLVLGFDGVARNSTVGINGRVADCRPDRRSRPLTGLRWRGERSKTRLCSLCLRTTGRPGVSMLRFCRQNEPSALLTWCGGL